jgi:RNA polymerase sigma-70 factor (ECF subfamily)
MSDSNPLDTLPDARIVEALLQGDEAIFSALVEKYHAALVRLALTFTGEARVAEEAAQETWLAVLRGLAKFEGRSSLKTWIFTILANRARTTAQRESRVVLINPEENEDAPSVPPDRFFGRDHPIWPEHWAEGQEPAQWGELPEDALMAQELHGIIRQAIDRLPYNQQQVILLRDIQGLAADEVCNILQLSETNQRVLLHRARSRVRQALEDYLR